MPTFVRSLLLTTPKTCWPLSPPFSPFLSSDKSYETRQFILVPARRVHGREESSRSAFPMADNSGINRRVDGQGNTSSSGPPQVELQLEESSFDLLVQDREVGRPEHRPSLVGRLSLDATPAPRPSTSSLGTRGSLESSGECSSKRDRGCSHVYMNYSI